MKVIEQASVAALPTLPRPLTAEEFFALPEEIRDRHEFVRGRLEELDTVPPGIRHGRVMLRVARVLMDYVEPRGLGMVGGGDAGFILERAPDTVRGPDVAFMRADRVPPDDELDGFGDLSPDLAVEVTTPGLHNPMGIRWCRPGTSVLSPRDRPGRVQAKVADYLRTGVRLVWVVDPRARTVVVHIPGQSPRRHTAADRLDGGDVLPGFSYSVGELLA